MLLCFQNGTDTKESSIETNKASSEITAETTEETSTDEFALLRGSAETWIEVGLKSYEAGEEAENLKSFFAEGNISYLTLYNHMFVYDYEQSAKIAKALFAYIYENHGAECVLDTDKRIEYKNEYLQSLGFNLQNAASYIQIYALLTNGYFDELISKGEAEALTNETAYESYIEKDGSVKNADEFDYALYFDCMAKAELEVGAFQTLGEAYTAQSNKECTAIGHDISYNQETSLISYLIDTYGVNAVMEAYETQDIQISLGKSYESLKAEWLEYLG